MDDIKENLIERSKKLEEQKELCEAIVQINCEDFINNKIDIYGLASKINHSLKVYNSLEIKQKEVGKTIDKIEKFKMGG